MTDVYVGVDVGGARKGFHAVAIRGNEFVDRVHGFEPADMARWCVETGAAGVGVDAPCRWSTRGRARRAERELAKRGIFAFATPSEAAAIAKPFYQWMIRGADLYRCLEREFPLFAGERPTARFCIETFPQAVACALAGEIVSAKRKGTIRRALLRHLGFDAAKFSNIDYVDAALCAVAAQRVATGSFIPFGDLAEGWIVIPEIVSGELGIGSSDAKPV